MNTGTNVRTSIGEDGSRALTSVSGQRQEWVFRITSYGIIIQVQLTHRVALLTLKTGYGSTAMPLPQFLATMVVNLSAFVGPVTLLFAPTPMLLLPTMLPPVCAEQNPIQQLARVTRGCGACRTSTRVVIITLVQSRTVQLRMTMRACVALRLARRQRD